MKVIIPVSSLNEKPEVIVPYLRGHIIDIKQIDHVDGAICVSFDYVKTNENKPTECLRDMSANIYEFYLFEGNQTMVDRDVKQMQNDGWELCGSVSTKFLEHGSSRMLIPLKRKIK